MHREAHRETKFAEDTRSDIGRRFAPPLARHGRISNRQTPKLLEIGVTHTKQMTEVISNRQ